MARPPPPGDGPAAQEAFGFWLRHRSRDPLFSRAPKSAVGDRDRQANSLAIARRAYAKAAAHFFLSDEYHPGAGVDLAFTNGVFHHIRPGDREHAAHYIFRALRAGGLLAFWENNPWNPGTRYVMWRIPFDRDAVPVWPFEAGQMLRATGFEILLEPHLARWPLGAQYQILCRKLSDRP